MRLIDADKLYPDCLTKYGRLAISDSQIANAPTVEEPKRPQGKWIDTGSGQECNVCHEIQYGYDNFRHFCANCGADMRKGGAPESLGDD